MKALRILVTVTLSFVLYLADGTDAVAADVTPAKLKNKVVDSTGKLIGNNLNLVTSGGTPRVALKVKVGTKTRTVILSVFRETFGGTTSYLWYTSTNCSGNAYMDMGPFSNIEPNAYVGRPGNTLWLPQEASLSIQGSFVPKSYYNTNSATCNDYSSNTSTRDVVQAVQVGDLNTMGPFLPPYLLQ